MGSQFLAALYFIVVHTGQVDSGPLPTMYLFNR